MPTDEMYRGHVYLVVSRRSYGGYSDNELLVRASHHRPKDVAPGEYVLPLRIRVPVKCLERSAKWLTVEAAPTKDAEVSSEPA